MSRLKALSIALIFGAGTLPLSPLEHGIGNPTTTTLAVSSSSLMAGAPVTQCSFLRRCERRGFPFVAFRDVVFFAMVLVPDALQSERS